MLMAMVGCGGGEEGGCCVRVSCVMAVRGVAGVREGEGE